jgi:uncharacterized protein
MSLTLAELTGRFAVCQLPAKSDVPAWSWAGSFSNVTRTADEISIVCDEANVPSDVKHQAGWACLKLEGPFEFNLTGILTSVLNPLRDAKVGIFAVSTFDTDYVMVAGDKLDDTIRALTDAGHTVNRLEPK